MSPRSFTDLLEIQAKSRPDLPVLRFLEDGEIDGSVSILTYTHLRRRAHSIASALRQYARPGDRVLLVFPPGIDFVEALFGAFYAGVIAVPAYAPDPTRLERSLARLEAIVADCAPVVALTTTPFLALARSLTNTFSGIRPADLPGFIASEIAGAVIAVMLMTWLLHDAERATL